MTVRSYSQVSLYEKCPRQFDLRYNEKLPVEDKPAAAQRGSLIHESIEHFFLDTAELHPEVSGYGDWLRELKDSGLKPEVMFCFDKSWNPVEWGSAEGHIRGVIDGVMEDDDGLVVYEWKTGNIYDEHSHQRMLYGLAALLLNETYDEVEVIAHYFDKHKTVSVTYPRNMVNNYKFVWDRRLEKLDNDPFFAANPGRHCNWCPFNKQRGGPCEFGG